MPACKETRDKPQGRVKKPYESPRLTIYGSIGDLTTGGSGHAMESSQGNTKRP